MKIVITDGFTLNPGDLSWDSISSFGKLVIFDRTSPDELIGRCKDAAVVITNKVSFDRPMLEALPDLKLIAVVATGFNIIDVEAARERGIKVCNVPDYGSDSVAQHTFALILEMTNGVGLHAASVRNREWQTSSDFSYALSPLTELRDKTLGIVGFGHIGKRTAEIAQAFGMRVLYYSRSKKETSLASFRELPDLFADSDIVSLHLPLKEENRGFINREILKLMKKSALLINTSRGALINEQDLADALNEGLLAGAGLDVLSEEPPASANPLLTARNCVITPHNAWMSKEARTRIMQITEENIRAFINGQELNIVS